MKTLQISINKKMRGILIDWLVEVHNKFKLLPETLFLTVSIIDRYLEKQPVDRQFLQLIGVTALFIACKYEEIYPPSLENFAYVTDKAFTKENILTMEGKIIKTLEFSLTQTSSLNFLEIYEFSNKEKRKISDKEKSLCRYLLELSLVEYNCIKYSESLKVCASIFLANKILNASSEDFISSCHFFKEFNFCEEEIISCAKELFRIVNAASKSNLKAVFKKFSDIKYFNIANLV